MAKVDVYEMVTDRIIEQLEEGTIPWHRPWGTNVAMSHSSGKPYSFLNQMLLKEPGEYITFKQVCDEGGKVKKGAKSKKVVFWKMLDIKEEQPDGTEKVKKIPYLQSYNVFNIDDCEGIERKSDPVKFFPDNTPIEAGELIANTYEMREKKLSEERMSNERLAPIFHIERYAGSNEAYYSPLGDYIRMPSLEQFDVVEEYYSTLFHEMTHSTMHEKRCNRKEERKGKNVAFGSDEYSKEELVAEIGSAFLMSIAGMEIKSTQDNSAAYIANWLQVLKGDKKFITNAAGKAEKAVKYILGEQEEV